MYSAALQPAAAQEIGSLAPRNLLTTSYAEYIFLRRCHARTEGYMLISDGEIARARGAIPYIQKQVEFAALKEVTAALWAEANRRALTGTPSSAWCNAFLRSLEQRALEMGYVPPPVAKDF
jgi:hypothetical protein